ncbi:MAG: hypothetical protein ABMA02_15045 [Saprospiraceae bacterium]
MKQIILLALSIGLMPLTSCNKDTRMSSSEQESLQTRLNADPEVKKLNTAFANHCRLIASFSPEELAALQASVKSCGFYTSTATIPELEKCLADNPLKETYVQAEKYSREYETALKAVEKRFPELSQFSVRERVLMISQTRGDNSSQILSDYQSRKKN